MQPQVTVTETRAGIRIEQPSPGRLRRLVLSFLLAVLLVLLLSGVSWLLYDLGTLGLGAVGWLLAQLARSYTFWSLLTVLALLLVLDRRGRLRLDWTATGVRSSWLFGPIEAFVTVREHADLPPLELKPAIRTGAGVQAPGPWILGWRYTDAKGRSGWLIDVARFDNEADGEALRQRLLAWQPNPALPEAVPTSDLEQVSSTLVGLVLGLPRLVLFGTCVVVLALAGESLGMQTGLLEPHRPWDVSTQADVSRLAWRFELRHRSDGHPYAHATLQAAVRLRDSAGQWQERPLALSAPAGLSLHSDGYVGEQITALAEAGLVPARLGFEVPRDLLPLARAQDGGLLAAAVQSDPQAASESAAGVAHWGLLAHIDRPGTHLPVLWTLPTLPDSVDVVYRTRDGSEGSVWLATDMADLATDLVDMWGFVYVAAFLAFLVGGFIFLEFFPGRWHGRVALLWLALVASTYGWSLLTPTLAGWAGIDRDLQWRIRNWMDERVLPDALPLAPLDGTVTAGHWSPQYSRYRDLLEQLDLLREPPARLPDIGSASAALAGHGRLRLQAMDHAARLRLLGGLDSQRMAMEGNRFLLDEVLAPELCRWQDEPDFGPQARRFREALRALDCG